jgi:hypothetical protein
VTERVSCSLTSPSNRRPAGRSSCRAPAATRTLADAVAVAIPIREADGTRWLPRADLQRLVALGWSEDRRLQDEACRLQEEVRRGQELTRAVTLMSSTETPAAHEVGRGVPGWNEPYRGAHDELVRQGSRSARLSPTLCPVVPGVIQEFAASGSDSGWGTVRAAASSTSCPGRRRCVARPAGRRQRDA